MLPLIRYASFKEILFLWWSTLLLINYASINEIFFLWWPTLLLINYASLKEIFFLWWSTLLRSRWSPVYSAKLAMWRLFHLSIVGQSILSGTSQFVCLKSSEKLEKRTRKDESLFTRIMREHAVQSSTFWTGQTSNWWVSRRTALTWHPMTQQEKNAWSTIFVARRCCCEC